MTDLSSAMRAMIDRPFIQSQKYKDQQMRARRGGAHPDILEFEKRLITRMRKQDVPLFCACCWRSRDEQAQLLKEGHTKAPPGKSPHNWGYAVDIVHGVLGWNLDPKSWALLGHIGKEISVQSGIEVNWGGDWEFYDPAHWELKAWKTLKERMFPPVS